MKQKSSAKRFNGKTCLLIMICVGFLLFAARSAFVQQKTDSKDSASSSSLGHYEITPATLPPPNLGPNAVNPPRIIPQPAAAPLHMPPGFEVSTFAEGDFKNPRWIALAPNGDVFVADSDASKV